MTIALIGASGYVGSAILHEALWRGHHVTAVVRNTAKLIPQPGLTAINADVLDTASLASVLAGHAAVVSAFSGHSQAQVREYYVRGLRSIIAAMKQARVPRLLVVGGAGSLDVAPGVQLVDTPHFLRSGNKPPRCTRCPGVAARRAGARLDHAEPIGAT